MATIRLGQKRYADAEEAYVKAIAVDPFLLKAYLGMSRSALLQNKLSDAFAWAERATQREPTSVAARFEIARVLERQKRPAEAIPHMQVAVRYSEGKDQLSAYRLLARLKPRPTSPTTPPKPCARPRERQERRRQRPGGAHSNPAQRPATRLRSLTADAGLRQGNHVMSSEVTRRTFDGAAAAAATASAAPNSLPTRTLGRTGAKPSILALGCGSRLLAYESQDKGVEAVNLAIDSGITYLDTAQAYGNGKSETWVGEVMKTRRKEVFLATKVRARDYDEAARWTEGSFKRLNTDQVDLIHIHNLWGDDDLAAAEKGVLKLLLKLREEKACRFIGVTSHTFPETLAKALERHDFDCTQMALNAALQGRSPEGANVPPDPANSFERIALPVAQRKNLGIIAMKVAAQDGLLGQGPGKSDIAPLLRYSLSLPVSVAVVGMPRLDHIRQNTQLARAFQPMPREEMQRFSTEMADANKVAMDRHFCCHEDA